MWVVSLRRLREFWADHPRAEAPLRAWYTLTAAAEWATFADLRGEFPTADLVGNCTVFNVAGNHYRLIARVFFTSHKVYVLRVITHVEYDRNDWPTSCRCYQPQPTRKKRKGRR